MSQQEGNCVSTAQEEDSELMKRKLTEKEGAFGN